MSSKRTHVNPSICSNVSLINASPAASEAKHLKLHTFKSASFCNCYHYDRAVHISVAVDMCTLLDRNHFSCSSNGHVAAHQVTGLIIKRLLSNAPIPASILYGTGSCHFLMGTFAKFAMARFLRESFAPSRISARASRRAFAWASVSNRSPS